MGSFQLFQEEELFLRFRPHFLSFARHYVSSFAWVVAGAIGAFTALALGSAQHPEIWGVFAVITLGLVGGIARRRVTRASMAYSWFGVLVGTIVALQLLFVPLLEIPAWVYPVAVGALLTLLRLIGWELTRLQRVHYLTSQRLVLRGGLGHRQEETLSLAHIRDLRSQVGPLGQLLGYGDIVLGLGTTGRVKAAREEVWILAGIGRHSEVKHQLQQLLEEQRLPTKERQKRVQERRVRESMRRLASWMRKDRSQFGPTL